LQLDGPPHCDLQLGGGLHSDLQLGAGLHLQLGGGLHSDLQLGGGLHCDVQLDGAPHTDLQPAGAPHSYLQTGEVPLDCVTSAVWSVVASFDASDVAEFVAVCDAVLDPPHASSPATCSGLFAFTAFWGAFAFDSAPCSVKAV
jgi:hypothetical protein